MPTLPVGKASNRPPLRGFTLIELLVVVSILAVLSLGVGLSAGGVFARPAGAGGERLESALARARDAALLGRQRLGLHPRADGWLLVLRDGAGLWQPEGAALSLPDAALGWTIAGRPHLPGLNDPRPQDAPPVQFGADGGSTPFTLSLQHGAVRLTCRAPAGGGLRCDAP